MHDILVYTTQNSHVSETKNENMCMGHFSGTGTSMGLLKGTKAVFSFTFLLSCVNKLCVNLISYLNKNGIFLNHLNLGLQDTNFQNLKIARLTIFLNLLVDCSQNMYCLQ